MEYTLARRAQQIKQRFGIPINVVSKNVIELNGDVLKYKYPNYSLYSKNMAVLHQLGRWSAINDLVFGLNSTILRARFDIVFRLRFEPGYHKIKLSHINVTSRDNNSRFVPTKQHIIDGIEQTNYSPETISLFTGVYFGGMAEPLFDKLAESYDCWYEFLQGRLC